MGPNKQRRKTARRKARQAAVRHLAEARLRRTALRAPFRGEEVAMAAAAVQMGMAVGAFRKGWGGPRAPTPSTD